VELKTEAEIQAPPEHIWEILTDFARYSEWNPFLLDVRGGLEVGSTLHVHAGASSGRHFQYRPRVLAVEPGRELCWRAHFVADRLFSGDQFFRLLTADGDRSTRLVHGATFTGWLVNYMGNFLTDVGRGFIGMNQALKRRAETRER
jgi:hypothetical protein